MQEKHAPQASEAASTAIRLPRRLWMVAGSSLLSLAVIFVLILQTGGLPIAQAATFSNSAPITIQDPNTTGSLPSQASPYPSPITVSGITGKVTKVQVTLNNLTSSFPFDDDVLLVAPGGQRVVLMSGTGGSTPVSNVSLTFDDAAAQGLSTPLTTGTYRPTQNDFTVSFPTVAGPYSNQLSAFNGGTPNGTWNLYVVDNQANSSTGSIAGGWTLNISTADVSITKSDTPDPVNAGSNITYTLTATNAGPDAAFSAIFTDTIPANTTFQSISAANGWACGTTPPVGGTGNVNCTNPSFGTGSAVFTLIVKVNPTVAAATIITNSANIASGTPDTDITNNQATTTTTVTTMADLSVTKSGTPNPVTAGTVLTYTITTANAGPSYAQTAVLTDTLPTGTTFKSLTAGAGWSCTTPVTNTNGTVSCTAASYGITATTFTLVANVDADVVVSTTLSNVAHISSATLDPNPNNNQATATTNVATLAELAIGKTGTPTALNAGQNVTYTLVVTNTGPSNSASTIVNDPLPANTSFQSLSSPGGWSCTTPALNAGGTVNCTNASFGMGSGTFTLVARVLPTTPNNSVITNTAAITSSTADPISGNNSASTSTAVSTSTDLSITKTTAGNSITAGTNLTYTVTVVNNGPSNAASTVLTDTLPFSTTFQSINTPSGWNCQTPGVNSSGPITCTNASDPLSTTVFTLVAKVDPALTINKVITNTAYISTVTTDTNSANNQATVTNTVATQANLAVDATAPDTILAGSDLSYSIVVTNAGPSNAASTVLTDTLPVSTTFQSLTTAPSWTCSTPVTGTAGTISCTNPSAIPGSSPFTLVVRVNPAVITGTIITNQLNVNSATADPVTANNQTSVNTTVGTSADLALSKFGTPDQPSSGSNINYTITLVNNGPSNSLGVVLTDTVPINTVFQSFTAPNGWSCQTPNVNFTGGITCTVASVAVTTTTFNLIVKVNGGLSNGTIISNTAYINSASTPDPTPSNNQANTTAGIGCVPNILEQHA